jgi:hypothetical protein
VMNIFIGGSFHGVAFFNLNYKENRGDMQQPLFLGQFMLPIPFSEKKQACRPEARAFRNLEEEA